MNNEEHEEVVESLRDALQDMTYQFAYRSTIDGKAHLTTGGLSALELAFDMLGWADPHPLPDEMLCQRVGCELEGIMGIPTDDGYKRVCLKHGNDGQNNWK